MNAKHQVVSKVLYDKICEIIDEIGNKYKSAIGLIITESDLKCQIYSSIQNVIKEDCKTMESEILGSLLHTEVAYYNPYSKNQADMFVDMTIFNPLEFSVKYGFDDPRQYSNVLLPNKSYRNIGDAILIELKFIKQRYGITETELQKIKDDVKKLSAIIEHNNVEFMKGIVVVFNKTSKSSDEFKFYLEQFPMPYVDIIYKSGDFDYTI